MNRCVCFDHTLIAFLHDVATIKRFAQVKVCAGRFMFKVGAFVLTVRRAFRRTFDPGTD